MLNFPMFPSEVLRIWICLAALAVSIDSFFLTRSHVQSLFILSDTSNQNNALSVEAIKEELDSYMEVRRQETHPLVVDVVKSTKKKQDEPYEFLKPTGWFRDEYILDIDKRSDKRIPKFSHPLSFVELDKYGYGHLTEAIMSLGGPHQVGLAIGLDWVETVTEEEVDESMRSTRVEVFNKLDVRGSLAFGTSLEEKLEAAAALDLETVKRKLKLTQELEDKRLRELDGSFCEDGEDYSKRSTKSKKSIFKAPTLSRDKFSMSPAQRLYFLVTLATFSFANGHATIDLLDRASSGSGSGSGSYDSLVDGLKIASSGLISASIASAGMSASVAKSKNRSFALWVTKGLLGGPLALSEIKGLVTVPPTQD